VQLTDGSQEVEGDESLLQVCCHYLSQLLRPHSKVCVAAGRQLAHVLQAHDHTRLVEAGVCLQTWLWTHLYLCTMHCGLDRKRTQWG
jgi:hypothetical protein